MERCQTIKKSRQTVCRRKTNSHNRPLKNKTILENVRRGTNNFCKSSVASTTNMLKCLKNFKFIMAPSLDIRCLQHIYHWKYGTNNFKIFKFDIIFFQKTLRINVRYPTSVCQKTYKVSVEFQTYIR